MSGELRILLLVLPPVVVGAAILIYYLRKRAGTSHAEPAPSTRGFTSRDRDATELDHKQDVSPLPQTGSRDEADGTPHVLVEEDKQGAAAAAEDGDIAVLDESAPRAEPGLRPGDRAEHGEISSAPHEERRETPPTADHARARDEAPLEIERSQSGTGLHVASDTPEPGVEPREASGSGRAEQPVTEGDHDPNAARGGQARVPAESVTPAASCEETKPGDAPVLSGHDVAATEEPAKEQPTEKELPPTKVDSVPDLPLEMPAPDDAAIRKRRETEESDPSSEQPEVVEEEADRAPEERTTSETPVPIDARGVEGVDAAVGPTTDSDNEEIPGPTTEGEECDSVPEGGRHGVDAASVTQAPRKEVRKKKPRKYKGLARAVPQPRDAEVQTARAAGEESAQRERSLPIEVRLRFDRGGFCSVSLIAKRSAGLPEDLTATAHAGEVNLRAMQDEWYQDVVPDDLTRMLRDGTVWTQEGANGQCTWSLSGRTLYVLADRPDISGYVSQPCLDLGRDHVVLCSAPLRSRVEEAIRETGAQPTTVLDESFGAPPGWVVFRGVVPNAPVAPVGEVDILNALRPLPRIEISLERGIRLGYAGWLDGHPPSIRVYGDPEHAAEVHIDGQVAACGADGAYRASGWDSLGAHTVWCSGTSRSYSIVPFDASWDLWEGYGFPVAPGDARRLAVCGPIVRAASTEPFGAGASISVSETNPVLLGPEPGQIVMAVRASSLRGAPCIASPCFRPVWALPRDPLHCDKKSIRILFVAGTDAAEASREPRGGQVIGAGTDVGSWCRHILDANRKGMKTDPDTESVRALWFLYKRLARRIWRSRR